MVNGLETFRDYFKAHTDKFLLIGGTATDIALSQFRLPFRATKDLDIVLITEALNAEFGKMFWNFIQFGQYELFQTSTGEKKFWRFTKPKNKSCPYMLELFSRLPTTLIDPPKGTLIPIPFSDEVSSLSAILLNTNYYSFIRSNVEIIDGLPILKAEGLIPMKAKAYIDLLARRKEGTHINSDDINKHKKDVFRLWQLLTPDQKVETDPEIIQDMSEFFLSIAEEEIDIEQLLGIRDVSKEQVVKQLKRIYGL